MKFEYLSEHRQECLSHYSRHLRRTVLGGLAATGLLHHDYCAGDEKDCQTYDERKPTGLLAGMSDEVDKPASIISGESGKNEVASGAGGGDYGYKFPHWVIEYSGGGKKRAGGERKGEKCRKS